MLILLALTLLGFQDSTPPPDSLSRLMNAWTTLELDTHAVQINAAGDTPQVPGRLEITSTYKESRDGSRLLREVHHNTGDPDRELAYHEVDGEAYSIIRSERNQTPIEEVRVTRDFGTERLLGVRSIPAPLHVWYAGFRPLPEAIGSAPPEGSQTILAHPCAVYTVSRSTPRLAAIRYALDSVTGIPLEAQFYQTDAAMADHQPLMVWTADSFDPVDGTWLPLRSHTTVYSTTGPRTEVMRTEYEVRSFHRNRPLAASDFAPSFGAGAIVLDAFASGRLRPEVEAHRQGGPRTSNRDSQTPTTPNLPPIDPASIALRADQQPADSRAWTIGGIAAGSVLIGLAWWLRTRQHAATA
jgi:hypothetical protein